MATRSAAEPQRKAEHFFHGRAIGQDGLEDGSTHKQHAANSRDLSCMGAVPQFTSVMAVLRVVVELFTRQHQHHALPLRKRSPSHLASLIAICEAPSFTEPHLIHAALTLTAMPLCPNHLVSAKSRHLSPLFTLCESGKWRHEGVRLYFFPIVYKFGFSCLT